MSWNLGGRVGGWVGGPLQHAQARLSYVGGGRGTPEVGEQAFQEAMQKVKK